MAESLKIGRGDAKRVIAILGLQGYVRPAERDGWMTALAGEKVSGSKLPPYTRERVQTALFLLRRRISETNHDPRARYKITDAVAFGDFLRD